MIRRLLRWRPHRPMGNRLRAEGWQPYDRADFARGTRGARGDCARQGFQHNGGPLAWQIRTARGVLFAYCENHAWDVMVERRAKRLRDARRIDREIDELLAGATDQEADPEGDVRGAE